MRTVLGLYRGQVWGPQGRPKPPAAACSAGPAPVSYTHLDVYKRQDELQRNINSSELSATDRYDLYSRLERIPKYNEVCHGNFVPSKVIISAATGEPYIIDWFHATQGNAAADAALTYLLLRMRGRREEAEQYLALFCEKSEIEPHYIRRWMPLVAASQTVVANARSRAVLQRWIDDPAGAQEMETEVNEA